MPVQTLKPHLALNVRDLARSIDFYQKLFAAAPAKLRTGYAKFDLSNPPLNLTLNQLPTSSSTAAAAAQTPSAINHLGIQVASSEDVLAWRARWIAAGLPIRDQIQTTCCYALQDKSWATDPDGNEWEVFVVLQDHLPESSGSAHDSATPNAGLSPSERSCCSPTSAPLASQAIVCCTRVAEPQDACCTDSKGEPCCV